MNAALQRAVESVGSQDELARRIGTSQSMITYWLNHAKKGVSGEFVLPIERETGVSRHDLRPDLYPRDATAAA